jgi:plasmid stability protein
VTFHDGKCLIQAWVSEEIADELERRAKDADRSLAAELRRIVRAALETPSDGSPP